MPTPALHPKPTVRRARVLDLLPEAVLLLDDQLRVVDHNGVAHRWLGLDPDTDLNGSVHHDDLAVLLATEAAVRASGPGWHPPVPLRMRHADGSWRSWSVLADNRLSDPEIAAIVLLARDISGRPPGGSVPADVLVRELVTAAPVELVTLDPEGRIRFAAGAGMVLDREKMLGRRLADFLDEAHHLDIVERARHGAPVDELARWDGRWWQIRYSPVIHDGVVTGTVGVFTDVTDRTLAEQELAASEAYLRCALDAVREALVVVDRDGTITSSNEPFRALFGARAKPGACLQDVVDEQTAAILDGALCGGRAERREVRLADRQGHGVWLLVSASPVQDDETRRLGAVVVLTDITAQKKAELELAMLARTDPVTGAASRTTLADRLEQALARREGSVAVLFCDVDGLKAVNDRHGHAAGDRLLREVAVRARRALRPTDTLVRYGGDEFVVVCDLLPDPADAAELAERVRAAVAQPLPLGPVGPRLTPTVSIGVATSPRRTTSAELLAAADRAVYAAKQDGRDTVRLDG
jgi:diguanylate cyclase (GGDEF)-like protein/PAS domain S-box-containing protein